MNNFCPNCGTKAEEGGKFCGGCGMPLNPNVATVVASQQETVESHPRLTNARTNKTFAVLDPAEGPIVLAAKVPNADAERDCAELIPALNGWFLVPLVSEAPVNVNGERLVERKSIHDTDILQIGRVFLKFEMPD